MCIEKEEEIRKKILEEIRRGKKYIKMFGKWGMEMELPYFIMFWIGLILAAIFFTLPFIISPIEVDMLSIAFGVISIFITLTSIFITASKINISLLRTEIRNEFEALKQELIEQRKILQEILNELRRR